jgi:hypothetical protein
MSFVEYAEEFVWSCDDCGLAVSFKPHDFWSCKDELKARGWGFHRDRYEGTWTHSCGKCARKAAASNVSILDRVPGRPK